MVRQRDVDQLVEVPWNPRDEAEHSESRGVLIVRADTTRSFETHSPGTATTGVSVADGIKSPLEAGRL